MRRTDSSEKTLMLGKVEGRRRKGDRGQDGWMASPTWWTWVWASLRRRTGKPGMRSPRVRHDWATELTELKTATNEILSFHYIRKVSIWESIPSFVYFSNNLLFLWKIHILPEKKLSRFWWEPYTSLSYLGSGYLESTHHIWNYVWNQKMVLYCLSNMQTWLKQLYESHWRNIK